MRAKVPSGPPAHVELLLETFQGLGHIGTETVHVRHRKCPEPLQADDLAFLFVTEGVSGELVHLHRERVWRYVHVPHDGEHAETGSKAEHHVPVTALEPVLPFAELVGMLKDRPVAKVIHDRSLHRCRAVREYQRKDIIGKEVTDKLPTRQPPQVSDVARRLVIHELF